MRIHEARIIELPRVLDARGSLSFVEAGGRVPFEIKRVFYIYEIPAGATRAGHAQRTCEQLIVAVSGAFDVISDDGSARSHRRLESAHRGFYVPPLTWLELENFTPGAVCLVLASEPYSEASYIRAYDQFKVAAAA
ncbi:MAG: WxcM-like domain-containing protein [Proteobacteria bacterium]|nr:WxcM-like domain-containing protein [Pseudomonadota bacterium]